jgi:hypothetical protein
MPLSSQNLRIARSSDGKSTDVSTFSNGMTRAPFAANDKSLLYQLTPRRTGGFRGAPRCHNHERNGVIDLKRERGAWGFALFWSAFMLFVDGMLGSGFVQAVRSECFATGPGVVTRSEIRQKGRRGASLILEYEYVVNGRPYTGTKYHVQPQFVGNEYWIAARDANPVGAAVTVHYDPDDPATAYQAPGLRPDALMLVWCLTPFNLVMLGLGWAAWGHLTGRREFDPSLRRCARPAPVGWLARPDPNTSFLISAFTFLLIVTFCGSFAWGLYVANVGLPPPWAVPLAAWALALPATALYATRASRRGVVHVNELEGAITFTHDEKRVTVPRERVTNIDAKAEARKAKSGLYEVQVVALRWRDEFDEPQATRLAEYRDSADAAALVAWLSERLNVPAAPVAE